MYQVNYKIETLSPVLVSDYSGDKNTRIAMDFIPGNVLLGITAGLIDKGVITPNSFTIQDLIFGEKILFGDAVITGNNIQALPAPMGFYHVKEEPPFPRWGALQEHPQTTLKPMHHKNAKFDKNDDRIWKPVRSVWLVSMNGGLAAISVSTITNVHNIIDSDSQRPNGETGGVFVYHALQSGQIFSGDIRFLSEDLAHEFFNIMGKERWIRIGKSMGAQYGEAKLTLNDPEEMKPPSISGEFVRILLVSDTIVKNGQGIYIATLTSEVLTEYLKNLGFTNITVERNTEYVDYFRTRIIQGFNTKWGQYRSNVPAIIRGSVFHFKITGNQAQAALEELYKRGLGERCNEGYGRIDFSHPLFDEAKIQSGETINVHAPQMPASQREPSKKMWWEVTGMPASVKKAVFKREIQKQISRLLSEECFNGTQLKHKFQKSTLSNTQLQGLRNIALRATSVQQIVDFMSNKENKKAYKEGQWNPQIKGISLFDLFRSGISDLNGFYAFLGWDSIGDEYRNDEYHLLAVQIFINQFVGTLIKGREKGQEVGA